MQSFAYIDETLDINITQSYELSIQISLNGLSFCLLDTVRNKFIALVHKTINTYSSFNEYLDILEKELELDELLNQKYKTVRLLWISNKNTLIPSSLFNANNLKQYFEFNQSLDELDEIHYTELKYAGAYSIFTIPNQIANIFSRAYNGIKFYNQQSPFIENALFSNHSSEYKAFVNIEKHFFDLIISQKGNLKLYNTFAYQTETDILYYIMYSFEKLSVNPEHVELTLNGDINKNSTTHLKFKEFIRHIKFEKHSDEHSYSYTFSKVPQHHFSNLFNLNLCE